MCEAFAQLEAHADQLLGMLREIRMFVKDFLARRWVGKPNTTTKE